MKKYLFSFLFLIANYCCAQHYEYIYDAAGNRTSRKAVAGLRVVVPPQDSITSKLDAAVKYGIDISPNPVSRNLSITISELENGAKAALILSDIQGKIILTKQQAEKRQILDVSPYKSGTYYLKIIIGTEKVLYKILKLE